MAIIKTYNDNGSHSHTIHECDDGLMSSNFSFKRNAVNSIYVNSDKNSWVIGNDEYETKAKYCPFCGIKLIYKDEDSTIRMEKEPE